MIETIRIILICVSSIVIGYSLASLKNTRKIRKVIDKTGELINYCGKKSELEYGIIQGRLDATKELMD